MDDVRSKMVLILPILIYNGDEIDHKVSEKILVANTPSWPKWLSIILRQYVPIQPSQTWKNYRGLVSIVKYIFSLIFNIKINIEKFGV